MKNKQPPRWQKELMTWFLIYIEWNKNNNRQSTCTNCKTQIKRSHSLADRKWKETNENRQQNAMQIHVIYFGWQITQNLSNCTSTFDVSTAPFVEIRGISNG